MDGDYCGAPWSQKAHRLRPRSSGRAGADRNAGAAAYFIKPYHPGELRDADTRLSPRRGSIGSYQNRRNFQAPTMTGSYSTPTSWPGVTPTLISTGILPLFQAQSP